MKKALSWIVSLALLCAVTVPAFAADTAVATTLRLEKTEGTVKVSNAAGKSVTITKGMRLYSGYTISTEKSSYAYVSLDSTKAVKLDASSKAEVQKSGKKLELNATAGKLFFNVTAPVDSDESLNIRTSTMVTGVRGTAGWVEVVDRFTSRVHLLEGTLTVTSAEPATGQMWQATISGGQTATATLKGVSQPGSQVALTVTAVQEKLVPGFVAVEVAKDSALQKKIGEKSPLSIPEIIRDAAERLAEEQKTADAAQEVLEKQLDKVGADEVKQVFTQPSNDSGAGSYVPPSPSPSPSPSVSPSPSPSPSAPPEVKLTNPTAQELQDALAGGAAVIVNVEDARADSDLNTGSYTVGSLQALNIVSGTFTVGAGQTLTVEGDFSNRGTVNVEGSATISGEAANNGTITIASDTSLYVSGNGTLTNNSQLYVGDADHQGKLVVEEAASLTNTTNGSIIISQTTDKNNSFLQNKGTFTNSGEFYVSSDGLFACPGTYVEERDTELYAMVENSGDAAGYVRYLGPAAGIDWGNGAAMVTLMGAEQTGTIKSMPNVAVSDVRLDLNGKEVTLEAPLTITNGGSLIIQDSTEEETGSLIMNDSGTGGSIDPGETMPPSPSYGTVTVSDGSLTLNSGAIANTAGAGILVTKTGAVTLAGGAVKGALYGICNNEASAGVAISGGTVTLTGTYSFGYAVSGPFTFFGGTLQARTTTNLYQNGCVETTGTLTDPKLDDTKTYYTVTVSAAPAEL